MLSIRRRPPTDSLGAWLMGLGAGDACPWCGGTLSRPDGLPEQRKMAGQAADDALTSMQIGRSPLVCGECGCEIDSAGNAADSADKQFNRAA